MHLRRGVICGLTHVNPRDNFGWNGECPGCDIDSEIFSLLCTSKGVDSIRLLNEQASSKKIVQAATNAVYGMQPNDLLVIYISGHGGQIRDLSGDEEDGLDETLCLWDGQFADDKVADLVSKIPTGVRLFFVTDTCNSGTNYRHHSFKSVLKPSGSVPVIHYGSSPDGVPSMGSPQGGVFTTALIDAYDVNVTYVQWLQRAGARMPFTQRPVYEEYGPVTAEYRNSLALT